MQASPSNFSIQASLPLTAVQQAPASLDAIVDEQGNLAGSTPAPDAEQAVSFVATVAASLPAGVSASYFQPVAVTVGDTPCAVVVAPSANANLTGPATPTGAAVKAAIESLGKVKTESVPSFALTTRDGKIVDLEGNEVALIGINMFGFDDVSARNFVSCNCA